MPCEVKKLGDSFAIACSRGPKAQPCKYCGRASLKLCDHKLMGVKAGKTCDIPMCERCSTHVEPDLDFCRVHAQTDTEFTGGRLVAKL
jgi:hypothetical protein